MVQPLRRSRLYLYALFVARCTLLLVMSGAAVTSSRDLPRQALFHHIHLAVAGADTLLIAGLFVWVPRAGWSALAIVIADAGLGLLSGPVAGTLHAFLALLLLASVAGICLSTSPSWQREPELVQDYGWPSLRFLSGAAAVLVAVQAGFGAGFRHGVVGVLPHLLGALVVVLFIMIVGAFVTHQFPKHATLRPVAVAFMAIAGVQAFLGMAAFLMRMMNLAGTLVFLGISVAHVANGSLALGVSVMLAMEVRRSVVGRGSKS
jgi:hypothetical protein